MRRIRKSFRSKNAVEVLYHRAKFGGARISPTAEAAKNVEFLSVCPFVLHAFDKLYSPYNGSIIKIVKKT